MTVLLIVNAVLLLGSAAFGAIALVRPAALAGTPVEGPAGTYYARMYASRAVPLGLVAAGFVFARTDDPGTCAVWLGLAGAVQLLDLAIGVSRRSTGMAVSAGAAAAVHLATFALLL